MVAAVVAASSVGTTGALVFNMHVTDLGEAGGEAWLSRGRWIGSRLLDAENNLGIGGLFGGMCWPVTSAFVIHG